MADGLENTRSSSTRDVLIVHNVAGGGQGPVEEFDLGRAKMEDRLSAVSEPEDGDGDIRDRSFVCA